MLHKRSGAKYLKSGQLSVQLKSSVAKKTVSLLSLGLILLVFASSLFAGNMPLLASAVGEDSAAAEQEEEARQSAIDAFSSLGNDSMFPEDVRDTSYLIDTAGDYNNITRGPATLESVIWEFFGIRYINNIKSATVPSSTAATANRIGLSDPAGTVYACNVNALGAGTAYYHNCDIPNLMTEFMQDAFTVVDNTGVKGGELTKAESFFGLGLPKNMPGSGLVPVDPTNRVDKYTALELYGYDLNWVYYNGEWDHIKTLSNSRLLTNFGFFDSIGLTGNAIGNAISNGATVSISSFADSLSQGDLIGAISGFFTGFYVGAGAGAIQTIVDTSDLNVILSFGWYRVNYSPTAYGLREMTDQELTAELRQTVMNYLTSSHPDDAKLPSDLLGIADGGDPPRKEVSRCEVVNFGSSGALTKSGWKEISPPSAAQLEDPEFTGVSAAACEEQAKITEAAWRDHPGFEGKGPNGEGAFTWQQFIRWNGGTWGDPGSQNNPNRKEDTVATWLENNAETFAIAEKYEIDCSATYGAPDAPAKDTYAAFKACWGGLADSSSGGTAYTGGKPAGSVTSPFAWNDAANKIYIKGQTEINDNWFADMLASGAVQTYIQNNQEEANFNAPWRRFVCLDSNGEDLKVGGLKVRAFQIDGTVNPACGTQFRPPVQGALFGSGYTFTNASQSPGIDTRHISNFGDPVVLLLQGFLVDFSKNAQENMLLMGQLATAISGEVITWTYSPILDALGISDIIVDLIESFRDSIFFPLVPMAVALAALSILWRAFRHGAYREAFTSVIYICLVFIAGTVMIAKPADLVDASQNIPAMAEEAIMGTVMSLGGVGDDELCTATNNVGSNATGFWSHSTPAMASATRSMVCQNWRTFVFTPWIFGQFGANYDKHYANGYDPGTSTSDAWDNNTEAWTGDAEVNMGGGYVTHNWAMYQLETTKSGTSNVVDPSIKDGVTSKDIYRIVDAQFGPNNGALVEGRYASTWSGANMGDRWLVAVLSPILAVFGSVVVISYAATKLMVSVVSTLMLVFLPFALLFGMFASKRQKLFDYLLAIVGYMLQRLVLTLVLAIFFVTLISFTSANSGNYVATFTLGAITCLIFFLWRKSIMGYTFKVIGEPQFGSKFRNDPKSVMREWPIAKSGVQQYEMLKNTGGAAVAASIGSLATGRSPLKIARKPDGGFEIQGAVADEIRSRNMHLFRKQRRGEGFDGVKSGILTAKQVAKELNSHASLDEETQELLQEIFTNTDLNPDAYDPQEDIRERQSIYEELRALPGYTEVSVPIMDGDVQLVDEFGQPAFKQAIVKADEPGEIIIEEPEKFEINYDRLQKPQDRRLAREYLELQNQSAETASEMLKSRNAFMKNESDEKLIETFTKLSRVENAPALDNYFNSTDLREKAQLKKTVKANTAKDLNELLSGLETMLPDSEGYTSGDRERVKDAVTKQFKLQLKQASSSHEKERIKAHLGKIASASHRSTNIYSKQEEETKRLREVLQDAMKGGDEDVS